MSLHFLADGITGTSTITSANRTINDVAASVYLTDLAQGDEIWYVDATGVVVDEHPIVDGIVSDALAKFTNPITTTGGVGTPLGVGVHSANRSPVPTNLLKYRRLTDYIRVTVSMPSLRNRYLMGGLQEDNSGLLERPHIISSLQGNDDGLGQLRTESLQPYEGIINIRFHNDYSEDVIINGPLFGYKINPEDSL